MDTLTPLARMLRGAPAKRATALDAFELARAKWLAGERLDIGKLAEELGVGRATVFRWVGSREQLYGEVISSAFVQSLDSARRKSRGAGTAFLTEVTRRLLASLVASQPLRAFVQHDPELAMRIVMSSPVEQRVIAAVRELVHGEIGHLQPELDVDSLAYVIVRIAESFLYREGDPDIETATKAISMLFATRSSRAGRASGTARRRPRA